MRVRFAICVLIPVGLLTGCQLDQSKLPWTTYLNSRKRESLLSEIEQGLAQQQVAKQNELSASKPHLANTSQQQSSQFGDAPNNQQLAAFRSVDEDLKLADNATAAGDLEEARLYYRRVLQQQPSNVLVHHRLAIIADRQKRFNDATNHYFAALSQQPNNADVLSDLGYSYFLQGKYQECESHLNRAIEASPNHRHALSNLGLLYSSQGDQQRALAMFKKAKADENEPSQLYKLASFFKREDQNEYQIQQTSDSQISPNTNVTTESLKQQMKQARLAAQNERRHAKELHPRQGVTNPNSMVGTSNSGQTIAPQMSQPGFTSTQSNTNGLPLSGPDLTRQIKMQMEQARLQAMAERKNKHVQRNANQSQRTEIIKYKSPTQSHNSQTNYQTNNLQQKRTLPQYPATNKTSQQQSRNQQVAQTQLQSDGYMPQYSNSDDPLKNMPTWPPAHVQQTAEAQSQQRPFANSQRIPTGNTHPQRPSTNQNLSRNGQPGGKTLMPTGFISDATLEQTKQAAILGMSMGQTSVMPFDQSQVNATPATISGQNFPSVNSRNGGFQYQPVARELPNRSSGDLVYENMYGQQASPSRRPINGPPSMNQQLFQQQQQQMALQQTGWNQHRQQLHQQRQAAPGAGQLVSRALPTHNYAPEQWKLKQYTPSAMGSTHQSPQNLRSRPNTASQSQQGYAPSSSQSQQTSVNPFDKNWSSR